MKNLGHRVGRSTIARILRASGIPPSRQRPMAWRTFGQAHWPALVAADFFTTEVWTGRGLVTYYVAFLLEVQSRRIQVIGCTPYPNEAFVIQGLRHATDDTGLLAQGRLLLCDRDPKWSSAVERWLATADVHIVRTPPSAELYAYAERFVRSRRNASIASFRSANGTCAEHCRRSPRTIIASGITRVLRTS